MRLAAACALIDLFVPWLALTGFLVLAVMLSLLIFVGEAVRDAFDPRKVL